MRGVCAVILPAGLDGCALFFVCIACAPVCNTSVQRTPPHVCTSWFSQAVYCQAEEPHPYLALYHLLYQKTRDCCAVGVQPLRRRVPLLFSVGCRRWVPLRPG